MSKTGNYSFLLNFIPSTIYKSKKTPEAARPPDGALALHVAEAVAGFAPAAIVLELSAGHAALSDG